MPRSLPERALDANRRDWDALVPYHRASDFYGVRRFLQGASTLGRTERTEVGAVSGKRLLHLQCHFGLDTLSWARRGARVTGVDFSPRAVATARELSRRARVPAEFLRADVHRLPASLRHRFDVVFASHGVLPWTPDLGRWMRSAARGLRPTGFLYLLDAHPFAMMFGDVRSAAELRPVDSYFRRRESTETGPGSYAAPDAPVPFPRHQWNWTVGDLVAACTGAGLRLEWFHEHDFLPDRRFPFLRRGRDGLWRWPPGVPRLPLSFSLKARPLR